jgi:hypothetical protein
LERYWTENADFDWSADRFHGFNGSEAKPNARGSLSSATGQAVFVSCGGRVKGHVHFT